jgi:hypothetical protein
MSPNFSEQLSAGRSLRLKLGDASTDGSGQQALRGDLVVQPADTGAQRIVFDLSWLGMVSRSIWTRHGPTGKISIRGVAGQGECSLARNGNWTLNVELEVDVLYDAIEQRLGYVEVEPGLYESASETFVGVLRATLTEVEAAEGLTGSDLRVLVSDLDLSYAGGGLGWIPRLRLPPSASPPLAAVSRAPVPGCSPERRSGRKVLKLRPIAFRDGSNDPTHSGTSWNQQLAAAKGIWGSCCMDLEADALRLIDNPRLRRSSDSDRIRRAFSSEVALDGIEVFLVDAGFSGGGGSTFSPGHAQATVVMTNRNAGNPNLLAHELGHVLSGLHPGETPTSVSWVADAGTVLEPSNSASLPNPGQNSLRNCRQARNPALVLNGKACCISPAAI